MRRKQKEKGKPLLNTEEAITSKKQQTKSSLQQIKKVGRHQHMSMCESATKTPYTQNANKKNYESNKMDKTKTAS
jgi:hypothetical protein